MYNLAIRKCTSPPLLAPWLKIFKWKFTTHRGSNPGPAEPEADMLPPEPEQRAIFKEYLLHHLQWFIGMYHTSAPTFVCLCHRGLSPKSGAMKSLPSVPHRRCGNFLLPPGDDFVQQWARHLVELTREFQNCEGPVLQNCLSDSFHKFWHPERVGNYGIRHTHWFRLQWIAHTIVWPYWNLTSGVYSIEAR